MNTSIIHKIKYLLVSTLLLICFNACKSESKQPNVPEINNTIEKALTKPSARKPVSEKIPLNRQELEDTFPFRIGDLDRDFINVSEDMATSEGAFGNGKVHLKIADAAGPLGSSIITMFDVTYDLDEDFPPTTRVEKKLRNGIKTVNRYETNNQDASIEFIYIDRFHMLLSAKKMTPDELWNLFEFDNYISSLQVLDDFDNKNIDRNH
ncbi:hypothetical protein U1E44_14015 [Arenibacter sp. GZD96]|uniref:hypothetical protein n=1 Tax=Aurantibrevibacter litoralis TaxID=3106030 RepID=UPI002AFEBC78|nr:hypothetical protein [Arenibacter sp. GZD-96]MEA1787213.1 hypothetical protein [Arenibacter sp. GZD-96]